MQPLTKGLVIGGVALIIIGVICEIFFRNQIPLGRLPGDINVQSKNFSFHFPLVTSLLLSAVGTALLYIYNTFQK